MPGTKESSLEGVFIDGPEPPEGIVSPQQQVANDKTGEALERALNDGGVLRDKVPHATFYSKETGQEHNLHYRVATGMVASHPNLYSWDPVPNPPSPNRGATGREVCWLHPDSPMQKRYSDRVYFYEHCRSAGFWTADDARDHVEAYHRGLFRAVNEIDTRDLSERQILATERQTQVMEHALDLRNPTKEPTSVDTEDSKGATVS